MLAEVLRDVVSPVADVDDPEIMLSERRIDNGRFVWAVNNKLLGLDPGLAWRMGLLIANRLPTKTVIGLHAGDEAVYDVFAMQQVQPEAGKAVIDLRSMPARLFAILPRRIDSISVTAPKLVKPGEKFSVSVQVLDRNRLPVDSTIPLRWRLLSFDGSQIMEQFKPATAGAATTYWVAPTNGDYDSHSIEVEECSAASRPAQDLAVRSSGGRPTRKKHSLFTGRTTDCQRLRVRSTYGRAARVRTAYQRNRGLGRRQAGSLSTR